ncbi:MAG: CBS domain-containing protein [Planctomycetales bacterium]|nr:CBS domain-containing protein [Planctomycetales bacterium]
MRVSDVMNRLVQTIEADATADEAWRRMRARSIRHLVVLEGTDVVGILSDRDLGSSRGAGVRRGRLVGHLMSPNVVTVAPDATLREAARLLRGRAIGCLPVFDGRRLVGILTASDVLDAVGAAPGRDRAPAESRRPGHDRRGGIVRRVQEPTGQKSSPRARGARGEW